MGSVLKSYCLTSNPLPETRQVGIFMNPKTDIVETRVYRRGRDRDVLCRLTYHITPYREGLYRWFLINIEELE